MFHPNLSNSKVSALTCTWDRSLSLNWTRTCSAPSSLNSFSASMALSSRSLCATRPAGRKSGKPQRCQVMSGTAGCFTAHPIRLLNIPQCTRVSQRESSYESSFGLGISTDFRNGSNANDFSSHWRLWDKHF